MSEPSCQGGRWLAWWGTKLRTQSQVAWAPPLPPPTRWDTRELTGVPVSSSLLLSLSQAKDHLMQDREAQLLELGQTVWAPLRPQSFLQDQAGDLA